MIENPWPAGWQHDCLERELTNAFEDVPIEDGTSHAAERILRRAFQSADEPHVLGWLQHLVTDTDRPSLASSLLRSLGRQFPGTSKWRAETVRAALGMPDVAMRDAAVQAAESWGEPEVRAVLEEHVEAIPWLQSYIGEVIRDLNE